MKALRLEAWQSPAVLPYIDRPVPGRGDVEGRAVVVPNEEYRP